MAGRDNDETKKVTKMLNYLAITEEIENTPKATMVEDHWSEEGVTEKADEDGVPKKKPYKWVMRRYWTPKFPSMTLDSIDIQEESAFWVADDVWRSHIYNIRCALESMPVKERFILWIDYDFFVLKDHPDTVKVAVDKYELGDEKRLKARKYHFWENHGVNLALSPAVQSFRFERDGFIQRHGLELKMGKFDFIPLDREVRYVEMNHSMMFDEEPFKSLEMEYFKKPTQMIAAEGQKRKREEMELDLPEVGPSVV